MIRVYVCHDHQLIREAIGSALGTEDGIAAIGESPQGTTGAERVRREKPDVAVVAVPPGEDPVALVAFYRDACPGAKIVLMLTGSMADEEPDTGADAVLDLSARLDRLVYAVRSVAGVPAELPWS